MNDQDLKLTQTLLKLVFSKPGNWQSISRSEYKARNVRMGKVSCAIWSKNLTEVDYSVTLTLKYKYIEKNKI